MNDNLLSNPPCFRSALMWGIATGALIGAHQFRSARNVKAACDYAILTFGVVATGNWLWCRASYYNRLKQTREFMDAMNNPSRKVEAEEFMRSRVKERED